MEFCHVAANISLKLSVISALICEKTTLQNTSDSVPFVSAARFQPVCKSSDDTETGPVTKSQASREK